MRGQFVKERVGLRSLWVWDWESPDLSVGGQSILEPAERSGEKVTSKDRAGRMSGPTFPIPPALFWGLPLAEFDQKPMTWSI